MRTPEDLNRFGGLSLPSIVIVIPIQGRPEVQVIASTEREQQALRLDLRLDEDKAALVAFAMALAGLGADDDEADE